MAKEYTKEQFWKLYEKLPQELRDALFAEETGDNIHNICQRNKIEKHLGEIVDYVGQVLLGVLTPEDFQKTLEEELLIEEDVAKKVSQEINRFILYPVKGDLASLYEVEFIPGGRIMKPKIGEKRAIIEEKRTEEKIKRKAEKDIYREPIE